MRSIIIFAMCLSLSACADLSDRPWLLAIPAGVGVALLAGSHHHAPQNPGARPIGATFPPVEGVHVVPQ